MATDTSFGEVRKFDDFFYTAIGDAPEIDVQAMASGTTAIVAGATDGRVAITANGDNGNEIGAVTFGALNWLAGNNYLKMEARLIIDDITSYTIFVGFGDALATGDETVFTATSDIVASGGQTDAIGILYDADASTSVLWCCAQDTNSITANQQLGSQYTPVAATGITLGCYLSLDRKSAVWYVDGVEVYRLDSPSTLVAAVDMVPGVWAVDESTGTVIEIDYLLGIKGRSST